MALGFQARGEIEDVAADWVGHVDGGGGVGKSACITRGLEVIEDGIAEHCLSIPRADQSGNGLDRYSGVEGLKIS